MDRRFYSFLLVSLFLTPFLMSCQHETNPAKYYSRTPDKSSERVLFVEEIRASTGRVIGYLVKENYQPRGRPRSRNIYYVYGPNYGKVPKGMITDEGWAYRYRQGGEKKDDLGPVGIETGVKRILNESGQVQFFRNGARVYH